MKERVFYKVKTNNHQKFLALFYNIKPKWKFTYCREYPVNREYVIFKRISNRGKRIKLSYYMNLFEPTITESEEFRQEFP